MKLATKLSIIFMGGTLASFLAQPVLAQKNSYPVASRAIFLAGCLTDEPGLTLQSENKVYSKMRTCVCLLDQFQVSYTNAEFITLFDQAGRNDSAAQQKMENFAAKHYLSCL